MADIRDSFAQIQIQILGQGIAQIIQFASSAYKLNIGENADINVSLKNNSANNDTLWCDYYINDVKQAADSWTGNVNAGVTVTLPTVTHQMPAYDITVRIRVGHMEATAPVEDETQSFLIELWATAALQNIVTNSPIESGQTAQIDYQVVNTNTQHGGTFWGGLFVDEAATTPYPGVQQTNPWQTTVTPGQTLSLTITIPNAQENISAYLVCGHVE